MTKKLILSILLLAPFLKAQSLPYTPPAYAAYISPGAGVWNPWTSAAAFGSLGFTPQAIGLYCQASAGSAWTPCAPGSGSSGVTSINTVTGAFTFTGGGVSCTGTTCTFSNTGSTAWSAITSGTNANALVIGTGGSLGVSGSGTIAATSAPISGITGLGTGVATFLGTPTSANLAAALTDETGTGAAVFASSPVFAGTPDASSATQFKLPVAAGYTSVANGELGYDTTNLNWHIWSNAVDNFIALFPVASPPTSGDCVKFLKSTNAWTLADAGTACGTGTTTNLLTMNNSGSGAASGTTFNGSAAVTLSYNTLGAAGLAANNAFTGQTQTQTATVNGDVTFNMENTSNGLAARSGYLFTESSSAAGALLFGPNYTPSGVLLPSALVLYSQSGEVVIDTLSNQDVVLAVNGTAVETVASTGVTFAQPVTISPSSGLVLSAMTGTSCLEEVSGVVTATGSVCGSGGGGDTITSPNSTLNVGGTSSATTLDLAGAAGEIMAGATPALTRTPTLGSSGNAGTLALFPASGNFTTTLGSAATASNTVNFFAAVPTNLHLFYCAVSSTTCTLTDTGYAYNAIPNADLANSAITIAGTSVSLGGSTSSLPSPGAIGGTTPSTGAFTTLTATTSVAVGSSVPAACGSASGCLAFNDSSAAGTPTSAQSYIYVPTSTSLWTWSLNGASETSVWSAAQGGSGVANTATHTLGTSNQNWATLGTGIVKNTTTTGAISDAASSDVISLWSGTCSSSTFLNGAGACATPSGSGTVTSVAETVPSGFAVSGTPITTSGTLGITYSVSAGGQIINSSASNTAGFTATPTLGASGTLGSLAFGNATSGLLTLETATGAITSYTLQLPVAQPSGSNTFLSCTAASPAVCTWAAGGGSITFPQTVGGTTTSGGIPYFSNATTLTSSAVLATNHVLLGGGAGGAPTSDSAFDDGATTANTLTYTGTSGIATPQVATTQTSNGTVTLNGSTSGTCALNVTATGGTLDLCSGNATITAAGAATFSTLAVASARKGTFVCTAAGTITISNTNMLTTSDVIITMNTAGGTITTPPAFKTVTAATGFTVLCGATDTSTYNYDILN